MKGILILHETGSVDSRAVILDPLASPGVLAAYTLNWKILSYSYFKYLFCSFLSFISFWYSYYVYVLFLHLSPNVWILYSLFCFLFLKSSLLCNLRSFYWHYLQVLKFFPWLGTVYWVAHQRPFFISVTGFLISSLSFWLFPGVSISQLTLLSCSYTLSLCSMRDLNIQIVVKFQVWSVPISAISASGSDPCLVPSDCVFFAS